jgi:Ser/Thr protein kinase RdoA (MazF antagonist)
MTHQISNSILDQYDIGVIKTIKPISSGLVHQTFSIESDKGQYIIQKLHAVLASAQIASDFKAVTSFLKQQGVTAPECVLTIKGKVLAVKGEEKWRMQTKIPGRSVDIVENCAMAKEAGRIFGEFHRVLSDINHTFESDLILHQTKKEYAKFVEALPDQVPDEVKTEVEFIRTELPKLFLPDTLPIRVIHGDPKISNILFNDSSQAQTIIDLDTCNRSPLLVELGDAFRSWCGNEEDDPKNKFCLHKFKAAWTGYKQGAGDLLTDEELKWLPTAIGTITLELSARFLADYFNDSYFGWDQDRYTSRHEHNLARARGQIAEYKSLQEKMEKVKAIIKK